MKQRGKYRYELWFKVQDKPLIFQIIDFIKTGKTMYLLGYERVLGPYTTKKCVDIIKEV